jgi:hypothetical protein
MRTRIAVLLVSTMALLSACSSVHVKPVVSASDEGVRFYRSLPYLLVVAPLVVKSDPPEMLRYSNDDNALVVVPIKPPKAAGSSDGKQDQQVSPTATGQADGTTGYNTVVLAALRKPAAPPPPADANKGDKGMGALTGQAAPGAPGGANGPAGAAKDSSPAPGPISIVYLPDPCQEYTITQNNYLSTQTVGIMLSDGWQLTSLQATSDNTGVVNSLIGLAGSALGGGKGAAAPGGGGGGGAKAQGAGPQLFIRTVTYTLTPGLYPLFQRTRDGKPAGCDGSLQFVNPWDIKDRVVNVQITPLTLQ